MANLNLKFPFKGVDKSRALCEQSPESSSDMNNMRLYDSLENRARGGQRPGLDKWSATQIGGEMRPVVAMCIVSSVD